MAPKDHEEGPAEDARPELLDIEYMETLKEALDDEKAKAEANLAGWQRVQADFINYKRRIEQEREDTAKSANAALILSLLPALDDLERALTSIPRQVAKHSWLEGIQLIEHKFRATLETQGLSQIEAVGEPFDPNLHEAAMQGRGEEGIVVQELQKGYKLYDRVIRPSRVVVGSGEEDEENKEE